jgi:type IV pilus assembly protein PilC
MQFNYKLTDNKGKISKGKLEAANIQEARNRLALQEGTLVSLEQRGQEKEGALKKQFIIGNMRLVDRVMMSKHLSVMIKSGMSIDAALEVLGDGATPLIRDRMAGLLNEVRKGNSFANALKKYPKDFNNLFVNMVAVGESSGTLAKNLEILAVQQHKTYELRSKIKAASIYPIIVLVAVLGLMTMVSTLVLPKLKTFFTALGDNMPPLTKFLQVASGFLSSYWWLIIACVFGIIVLIQVLERFYNTRLWLHYFYLKIPIVGHIIRQMNLALYCRTMASLLNSGITIDQSLKIVSDTLTNAVYREQLLIVYHNILKGNALSDAMANRHYFPPMLFRMIKVGENSGNLSEVLDYLADFYEDGVDNAAKNFSSTLEPVLLIMIGLTVGVVALGIIQPIFKLMELSGA